MKKYFALIILLIVFSTDVFSTSGKKEIRLRLQDSLSILADETDIYLDLGSSPAYLPQEDARKNFDTVMAVPQVYSLTSDAVPCGENLYGPFSRSVIIGIGFRVAGGSIYILSAALIDNFDPTSIILLEDRAAGVYHDMREGSYAVKINQAQQTEGRFFLHISYPPSIEINPAGCNNDDGSITVDQDSSVLWSSIQLFDSSNRYVVGGPYNNIKGDFNFSSLREGYYNLAFVYGVYSVVKPVYITGNQITCNVDASTIYATVGQQVMFNSNARNATGYVWNFGDSTIITGVANTDYTFNQPGTYMVSVQCTNSDGCSAYAYITIYVGAATAIPYVASGLVGIVTYHRNVIITTSNGNSYHYEIYNLSGQMILSGPLDSSTSVISMPDEASGVYILRLKSPEGNMTRKIFLE